MADPKTQCSKCGKDILVATASRTGGLCMPCKQGAGIRIGKSYAQAMEDLDEGRNIEQSLMILYSEVSPEVVKYYKKEAERRRTQTGELEVPVFGKVVRRPGELLMFREFPYLRQFGQPEARATDGKPFIDHLSKKERRLVEAWKTPTVQLAEISGNGAVHASLRYLGVFEVAVAVPDDGLPFPSQEKAYEEFSANEEAICASIVEALMRYYHYARKEMPDFFDYLNAKEKPKNPTIDQLAKLILLYRMTVCLGSANGVSPLLFGWSPVWDEEHGLSALVYDGQVIAMGPDAGDLLDENLENSLDAIETYGWGTKQRNDAEKKAFEKFVSSYKHVSIQEE